jgi:hypothetical protein
MISRRAFLKGSAVGAGTFLFTKLGVIRRAFPAIPGGSLDPTTIPKYAMPLVIPPAMPRTGRVGAADYYEIAVRRVELRLGQSPRHVQLPRLHH